MNHTNNLMKKLNILINKFLCKIKIYLKVKKFKKMINKNINNF